MSPTAHIIKRRGRRGLKYHVRFRWRPSDRNARHFIALDTKADAETARSWVMTEIANGRYPTLDRFLARGEPSTRTLAQAHEEWVEGRVHEVGESARKQARQAKATYGRLATMDPEKISVPDCRRWVREQVEAGKAKGTISAYRSVIRAVLDSCDLPHPNPMRDPRVKLPRDETVEADPPSWAHHQAMLAEIAPKHRELLVFLERTGLRDDSEALIITWGDVDWRDDLLRVRTGKTRAARRWVPMLPVVRELLEAVPADERDPKRVIFPGITGNSMRSAMRLACSKAGIPTYTPHDLRHRYTSLLVMGGVPPPLVSRIVGHTKKSLTLDTYSHVLLDEPIERLAELRAAAYRVPGALPILPAVETDAEVTDG